MANQEFRFSVGTRYNRRSGIWKVWSTKHSDVYISCREMKGEFKVILHQLGNFKAGFTEEYQEKHLKPYGAWHVSRHHEQWHVIRPVMQPVLTCRFLFPESELRHVTETQKVRDSVCWLDIPPIGYTVCVEIVLAPAHSDFNSESPRPNILKTWSLASGETI